MTAGGPFRLALVGWPVEHSLSPALWEAMARRRGIALEYAPYPTAPEDDQAWETLWASDLSGFNVTAPWKERAAEACDRLAGPAARIGAVNTVLRRDQEWAGWTTDGYGFVRGLLAVEEPLRDRRVAVLGTGGAGRSVARAAAEAGAEVTLVSRTPSSVPPGCEDLPRIDWEALVSGEPFDVVVNATPLGRDAGSPAPPVPFSRCCRGGIAVDLNYSPPVTAFLRAAHDAGARTLNGMGMLIHQACLGAALLFDQDPSAAESYEDDFRAAAREAAPGSPH